MPRLSAVLVIDADPKGLEALTYGLADEGCRVTGSTSYAGDGGDRAGGEEPQVAVVVARTPAEPALARARALRAPSSGPALPVLVLGPAALRQEARAIPGVEFLPLPVFVRDVLTAARMLAAFDDAGRGGQATPGEDPHLRGTLSDYGLFFLLRTMIGLGRSGILHMERANRRGEIRFLDGEVTATQVGSLQGSAALHHLLLWEEATLDLKLRSSVHRGGQFTQGADDLLEEAERFLRDFAHASKDMGPTDTVLVADQEKASHAGQSIPAEVVPVVRLFDGVRDLGDVIEDSPFRVFDTLRIVGRLLDLGIVKRRDPQAPVPAAPDKRPPLQEWLGSGATPPALRETPAPSPDQRTGLASRRRTLRRDKQTLEQGTVVDPAVAAAERAPAPPARLAPSPPPAAVVASVIPLTQLPAKANVAGEVEARVLPAGRMGRMVSSGVSIEIDPALMAEGDAMEMASTPDTPPPVVVTRPQAEAQAPAAAEPAESPWRSVAAPAPASPSAHPTPAAGSEYVATGAPAATSEASPSTDRPPPAEASPVLEPNPVPEPDSPSAEAAPTATAPTASTEPAPSTAPPAPTTAAAAGATPHPTAVSAGGPSGPTKVGRRPSSEFDPIEKDFFAREADLYKEEPVEGQEATDRGQRRGSS